MSSNGRLLRKLRRIMRKAVAVSSLVACSSQVSCAQVNVVVDAYGTMHINGNGTICSDDINYRDVVRCVVIREGVTEIGEKAFRCRGALEKVVLPSTLTKIGEGAFEGCEGLKKINIPEGVTVGDNAFRCCGALEKVVLPSTLTKIGEGAFESCKGLKEINIPEGVTEISKYAFRLCKALEKLVLPSTLTKIGEGAFDSCEGLKEINIPEGVTEISKYAFRCCYALEKVVLPSTLTKIEKMAFESCKSLKNVEFNYPFRDFWNFCLVLKTRPNGNWIKYYKDQTFMKHIFGSWLYKPRKISILEQAFYDCPKLENFDMPVPDSCSEVAADAFDQTTTVRRYPRNP